MIKTLFEIPKLYETTAVIDGKEFYFITAIHCPELGNQNISKGYGQTLGGCRVMFQEQIAGKNIGGKQNEARKIASALSRDMTYKWLILYHMLSLDKDVKDAELKSAIMGGGKSIIIAPSYVEYINLSKINRKALFRAFGKHIASLNGKHITAVDMNTSGKDMDIIGEETSHVVCKTIDNGGTGNPSYTTALGVYNAAVEMLDLSDKNPNKASFLVQGVGEVGKNFIDIAMSKLTDPKFVITDLLNSNCDILLSKYPDRIKFVSPDKIYSQKGDIFIPCAIPNILNENTVSSLYPKLVCGGANDIYPSNIYGAPQDEIVNLYYANGYIIAPAPAVNLGGILHVAIKGLSKFHDGKERGDERANKLVGDTKLLVNELYTKSMKAKKPIEHTFNDIVKYTYSKIFED